MSGERRWPLGLALVLFLTVAGNVGVYVAANRGDALAIEPDYYRRAVMWDSTLAEAARSRALGWSVAARLGAPSSKTAFGLSVRDAADVPVTGAQVHVEGFAVAHATREAVGVMAELLPGQYVLNLPVGRAEWYEFHVVAEQGGRRFVSRLRCLPGAECAVP